MARSPRPSTTAAQVLSPLLRRGVADLRSAESAVRLDTPGSAQLLHDATRRLSSFFVTARQLVASTHGLEDQLRTCRKAATPTRDVDALRRRLLIVLADEAASAAAMELRERLDRQLEGRRRRRWLRLVEYLDDPAFDVLARRIDAFADLTPWSEASGRAATDVLGPLLERQVRRLDDAMHQLTTEPGERDVSDVLRAVRKRAESARYLSDALVPGEGDRAKRTRKAMRRTQTALADLREILAVIAFLDRELRVGASGREERRVLARMREREAAHAEYVLAELVDEHRPAHRRGSAS